MVPGMVTHAPRDPIHLSGTRLDPEIRLYGRWLDNVKDRAENTIRIYTDAAARLAAYVVAEHEVTDWSEVRKTHIEEFLGHVKKTGRGRDGGGGSPGYRNQLYRSLSQFFKWWVKDQHEQDPRKPAPPNPMEYVEPPEVKEKRADVLSDADIAAILATCEGPGLVPRRDKAILMLFFSCGMRRAELAGMTTDDIQIFRRGGVARIKAENSKTGEAREIGFGEQTAYAIDRYLVVRDKHPRYAEKALWLGEKGKEPLEGNGIYQMIKRRGQRAGIKLYPHMLRHTWAHIQKREGVPQDEVMAAAGWRSPQMFNRYARSTAEERAKERAMTSSPLDRMLDDNKGRKKR